MTTDRRSFLKTAALCSGAIFIPAQKMFGSLVSHQGMALESKPVDPDIPKRMNWKSLPDADKKAFIEAVKSMKGTLIRVPAGFGSSRERRLDQWAAQAESHQWYCRHGSSNFLPWHRSYLYHFELYLRKQIRDSFRLPYWDWTTDQVMPRELQDADLQDLLQITRSSNTIAIAGTPGRFRTKEWWQAAYQEIAKGVDYDTIGGDLESSGSMESPYHDMVHSGIGGDMGRVPLSGKDPLFWLHHCNVDRLWSLWMEKTINAGNVRNLFPSVNVASWLNTPFTQNYWTPAGTLTSATVKTSLFTEDLGYNYDTIRKIWTLNDIPTDLASMELDAALEPVQVSGLTSVPGSLLALQLTVPDELFQNPRSLQSLRLKVKGLPQPSEGRFTYAVRLRAGQRLLTLPEIAFFPGSHALHHGGGIGLSLTEHLEVLRAQNVKTWQLAFVLQNEWGEPVAMAEAGIDTLADAPSWGLKIKAVLT